MKLNNISHIYMEKCEKLLKIRNKNLPKKYYEIMEILKNF